MKILFLPSWYPSAERPIDGVFIRDQARAVATRHDVAVLVPGVSSFFGLLDSRRTAPDTVTDEDGIPTFRIHAQSYVPRSLRASFHTLLRATRRGIQRAEVEWGSPDLIHAHVVLPCGWIGGMVAGQLGIPCVLTEHRSPFEANMDRAWKRRMTGAALDRATKVIALSPSLAKTMSHAFPSVQPTIIGEVLHDPCPGWVPALIRNAESPVRLAFVGGLREQKGPRIMIEALATLVSEGVDLHLEIAGDGPLRVEIEALIAAHDLGDRCRLLGQLPREQVFDLYRRSHLAVVSSLHETFCLAAAEALAHGLPVVTTRCGGPEHFIDDDNGTTVEADSSPALASGIRTILGRLESFNPRQIRNRILDGYGPGGFLSAIQPVYDRALKAS